MRLEMYCFAYYPLFMAIGALTRWWVWRLVGPIPGRTHMELVNLLKRRAAVNTITNHHLNPSNIFVMIYMRSSV